MAEAEPTQQGDTQDETSGQGPSRLSRLLSKDSTHLGLVIRADGDGLKAAAAVIGQHR